MKLPGIRTVSHPWDPAAVIFHPVGTMRMPHTHQLLEDWPVDVKNVMGSHIDRWHFRVGGPGKALPLPSSEDPRPGS